MAFLLTERLDCRQNPAEREDSKWKRSIFIFDQRRSSRGLYVLESIGAAQRLSARAFGALNNQVANHTPEVTPCFRR